MEIRLVLFLLALAVAAAGAAFDADTFLAQVTGNGGEANCSIKSTTAPCCYSCICTKSIPSECRCIDVGAFCHSACKKCICPDSNPHKCSCLDTTSACYDPCPTPRPPSPLPPFPPPPSMAVISAPSAFFTGLALLLLCV